MNDTELHIIARGRHDATGIEYGATIELEADTNRIDNADETWVFVRGGFGELRLGDTDSAANNMKVGGYTVAVGTGGIDGTLTDSFQSVLVDYANRGTVREPRREQLNNTKAVYYSPSYSGFQLGLSYTPDLGFSAPNIAASGDALAVEQTNRISDEVTAGLAYSGLLGPVGVRASVVGAVPIHDARESHGLFAGAAVDVGDFSFAGGAGFRTRSNRYSNEFDPEDDDNSLTNQYSDRVLYNLGAAYRLDPFAFSVSYGWSDTDVSDQTVGEERNSALVLGAEAGLLPGLVLSTEAGYFSAKRIGGDAPDDVRKDNDGWIGVTRLALAF